jgi:hypothetical protein
MEDVRQKQLWGLQKRNNIKWLKGP